MFVRHAAPSKTEGIIKSSDSMSIMILRNFAAAASGAWRARGGEGILPPERQTGGSAQPDHKRATGNSVDQSSLGGRQTQRLQDQILRAGVGGIAPYRRD